MRVLWWASGSEVGFPVRALTPTRPSSNTPFLFCGGSVFGIPASESLFCTGVLGRGMSPGGGASTRSYSYILEELLCAPGLLLLRLKDAVRRLGW